MEQKIGEIFEYEGNWYQCVEPPKNVIGNLCKRCDLRCPIVRRYKMPECRADFRPDGKYVIYKKLEPVGDPYPLYDHIVQRYAGVKFPVGLTEKRFINCNEINNTVDIEVKQDNQNTEDMEANEKTMPVPDGWEFDRIDDSGNIVLKEKKEELPKTWNGCIKALDGVEYIANDAEVYQYNNEKININTDKNLLPCGLGKPILALCQLLVCRDAWWKQLGWKPDWNDNNTSKYCIITSWNKVRKIESSVVNYILAFPTTEVCEEFLYTFRDLIKEAKELL